MAIIPIKSPKEIEIIAEGGRILAGIMEDLKKRVRPGVTTKELDMAAESHIFKFGGKPAFKGHEGFPATLCTSLNEEIVHVIPSERILKEEDIISLDLGILFKGFYTDMAITIPVNEKKANPKVKRLIRVTKKALKFGIKKSQKGNTFGDIGNTIQRYVEGRGFSVVKELCGHGIGKQLHEDPQIPNYGKRKTGEKIKEGMVFCIEPMVTAGDWKIKKASDGYGYRTVDSSLSCHFEHTIAITDKGPRILTSLFLS